MSVFAKIVTGVFGKKSDRDIKILTPFIAEINSSFNAGESVGTIEAVKTVADIFTPLNCKIAEVNKNLEDKPGLVNEDPYISGWILKIRNFTKNNPELLSASEYKNII